MNDDEALGTYTSWESLRDELFPGWRRWDRRLMSRLRVKRILFHSWLHSILFPEFHEYLTEEQYCYCVTCMNERDAEYAANPPIWKDDAA